MLKCKLTAIDIEYNYNIVIAQNNKIKKDCFPLVHRDSDSITGINSNSMTTAAFPSRVSFTVTEN